jgi:hypothetical protein
MTSERRDTSKAIHLKQPEIVGTVRWHATIHTEGMLLYTQTHMMCTHTQDMRDLPAVPLIISKTLSRAMSPKVVLSMLRHVCECKREWREEGVSRLRDEQS